MNSHTGKSTKYAVKPLRREGRMLSAGPVCSCARSLCAIAHETAGAARTRSSLRPLFLGRANEDANLGQFMSRDREIMSAVVTVEFASVTAVIASHRVARMRAR